MEERKSYLLKDSAVVYILVIVAFFCASVFIVSLVQSIAILKNADTEVVSSELWMIYLNLFLSEFVYFIVYVGFNFHKRKDFKIAGKIKSKVDYKIVLFVIVLSVICILSNLNITNLVNYVFSFISPVVLDNTMFFPLNNFWQFFMGVLLLAVMPAICEELIFRGIIYNGLRQKFSAKKAILLSTVMFVIIHFSIYKTFYQIILGVILGCLVYFTGSIIYGIIFHFFNNFFILFLSYAFPNQYVLQFTTWGIKEVFISIAIFLFGAAIIIFLLKILRNFTKKRDYFELENSSAPLSKVKSTDEILVSQNIDVSKLSDYDKKLLTSQKISDKGWLAIGVIVSAIFWFLNSFGGLF